MARSRREPPRGRPQRGRVAGGVVRGDPPQGAVETVAPNVEPQAQRPHALALDSPPPHHLHLSFGAESGGAEERRQSLQTEGIAYRGEDRTCEGRSGAERLTVLGFSRPSPSSVLPPFLTVGEAPLSESPPRTLDRAGCSRGPPRRGGPPDGPIPGSGRGRSSGPGRVLPSPPARLGSRTCEVGWLRRSVGRQAGGEGVAGPGPKRTLPCPARPDRSIDRAGRDVEPLREHADRGPTSPPSSYLPDLAEREQSVRSLHDPRLGEMGRDVGANVPRAEGPGVDDSLVRSAPEDGASDDGRRGPGEEREVPRSRSAQGLAPHLPNLLGTEGMEPVGAG